MPGVALAVEQCGREGGVVSADGVLDEGYREGLPDSVGLLPQSRLAGLDGGAAFNVVAGDEVADKVTSMGPQAEDGMQAQP